MYRAKLVLPLLVMLLSIEMLAAASSQAQAADEFETPGANVDASSKRTKTVVLRLTPRRGIDPALALALTDVVQGVFASDPARQVFGPSDIAQVMAYEADKQLLDCDTSCLSELSLALDADRLIAGTMDRIGGRYYLVLKEIDAKKLLPVAQAERDVGDESELVEAVRSLALDLQGRTSMGKVKVDDVGECDFGIAGKNFCEITWLDCSGNLP